MIKGRRDRAAAQAPPQHSLAASSCKPHLYSSVMSLDDDDHDLGTEEQHAAPVDASTLGTRLFAAAGRDWRGKSFASKSKMVGIGVSTALLIVIGPSKLLSLVDPPAHLKAAHLDCARPRSSPASSSQQHVAVQPRPRVSHAPPAPRHEQPASLEQLVAPMAMQMHWPPKPPPRWRDHQPLHCGRIPHSSPPCCLPVLHRPRRYPSCAPTTIP